MTDKDGRSRHLIVNLIRRKNQKTFNHGNEKEKITA